jgi:nicotinamide mononucleotide transporter
MLHSAEASPDATRPISLLPSISPGWAVAAVTVPALVLGIWTGFAPMSPPEAIGIGSGFVGVWLARRESPLAWFAFCINAAAFGLIFYAMGAFANVAFQAVIFILCLYGLAYWLRGGDDARPAPIVRASRGEWLGAVAICVVFTAVLMTVRHDTPLPIIGLDAATTAMGMVATWLQSRKRLEGWLVNAAMIVLLIPLFVLGGAYALAITAPAFAAALVNNHFMWLRLLREDRLGPQA